MNRRAAYLLVLSFAVVAEAGAQQYVYPANGQSPEQQQNDEAACYSWAVQQTGVDPANPPTQQAAPRPATTASGSTPGAGVVGAARGAIIGSAVGGDAGTGAAIGAVTGVIVAKGRVQAFIATLVMMLLLRGVTMVYTNGSPVNTGFTDNADLFGWFGIGRPLGIPTPVWIMAIVFLAAWYMLHHTRLGRYIYALGGNEAATRLSGISVNKVKIIVYSLCGLLASLAGIIEVARLSSAQPTAGTGYELDAIAAVVLGGTSLAGGKGRIVGTLIGALILGFLNNGLNLLGVSSYYQMIVKAVVILLAVLVDNKKQ